MPALKKLSRDEIRRRREELHQKVEAGKLRLPEGIRQMRHALGMTQVEFAKNFGLTRVQLVNLENGKANPTMETLTKVGRPFGFSVGFVLTPRD